MRGSIRKTKSLTKYLPVLIILLSITIMVGSTFAYFTDKIEKDSSLTFSKVELSSETTLGINGEIRDVIPGSKMVDGPVAFSKTVDSEAIYVRAKISFTLDKEYENDVDMLQFLKRFRLSSDFNIVSDVQHGAVWSEKDGSYYYLLDSIDSTNLKRVDTTDTYTLSNEILVPRDLENLEDNAQYLKGINFHIAFEAIQADNVSAKLDEAKQTFDLVFPSSEIEEKFSPTYKVTYMCADLESVYDVVKVNDGQLVIEPTLTPDGESERAIFEGWYTDKELITLFKFDMPIMDDITLYPKYIIGDTLTIMSADSETIMMKVLVPDGEKTVQPTSSAFIDENGTSTHMVDGYYTDSGFITKFEFGTTINQSYTVYPKTLQVSKGLEFTPLTEAVANNSPDFRVSNEGITSYSVADGTCADASIVVPEYYLGKPVTQVTANGFKDNTTVIDIYLPNTIHTLNTYAFSGCSKLVNAPIPESVISIGSYVFNNCKRLSTVVIPEGVTKISAYSFYKCSSLQSLDITNNVTNIEGSAFGQCTGITELTIPQSVTEIGQFAFSGCSSITMLHYNAMVLDSKNYKAFTQTGASSQNATLCIGANVTIIPSSLFMESYFVNLIFEDGSNCETIDESAFKNCRQLKVIEIPESVTTIGLDVFNYCIAVTNIKYNAIQATTTNLNQPFYYVGNNAEVSTLTIGAKVVNIPANMFHQAKFKNVVFSQSSVCESIGSNAFYACDKLESVELATSIKTIDYFAFFGCSALNSLEIPSSVTSIKTNPFANCPSLSLSVNNNSNYYMGGNCLVETSTKTLISAFDTSIIPQEVLIIGSRAFYGLTLTSIEIPESVTTIKSDAFTSCTMLNEIIYNAVNVQDISSFQYVFSGVGTSGDGISVTIGDKVQKIPANLFYSVNITSVIFADGGVCASIGSYTFANCVNLKSINIPRTVTSIETNAFSNTGSAYILCVNDTIAGYASGKGNTNIYVVDSTTDFSAFTFIEAASGLVNGVYDDGANYYVRTGVEGSYIYYKKHMV